MNIKTATPAQIDTEIANLSLQVFSLDAKRERIVNNVLSHAGFRQYVSATWATRRSGYQNTGTFEQAVTTLREYYTAVQKWRDSGYAVSLRVERLSNYSGEVDVDEAISDKADLEQKIEGLRKQIIELQSEWIERGRWTRMFMVTSSAGHIHSSTNCKTTRPTTGFGWMPEYSGLTEAQLLEKLGAHAEAACTICYPNAPVKTKAKKITVAKAEKMIAGPVLKD